MSITERIEANTTSTPEGCWIWSGHLNRDGYAPMKWNGKTRYAHRVIYEETVGPIPEGMQLDHLCRIPACVNPAHLEPVTQRENVLRGEGSPARQARQTQCVNGHPFDDENTYVDTRGKRVCRTCQRRRMAEFYERRRAGSESVGRRSDIPGFEGGA